MTNLKIPLKLGTSIEAHMKWLEVLKAAKITVDGDIGHDPKQIRIKERHLPPQVLGKSYVQYCDVINRMYDAYLNSVHLQRAPYILELVSVLLKRMCELRKELMYLIVNDYIYVDDALVQLGMTPYDIELLMPYNFPLEGRSDSTEQLLLKMWSDSWRRINVPPVEKPAPVLFDYSDEDLLPAPSVLVPVTHDSVEPSFNSIISEDLTYDKVTLIQKCERYRQYYMADHRAKVIMSKTYKTKVEDAPLTIRKQAATVIQNVYREFMIIKRRKLRDTKRDVLLGLIPSPAKKKYDLEEENNKIYEKRRQQRAKIQEQYEIAQEKEKSRLLVYKKENQIEDIIDQIRAWFKEWYYGYGFFPQYPYPAEGGTIMVMTGDYPTVEEKIEEDEKYLAKTKGKTKEQLKQEEVQKEADAAMKAELDREAAEKLAEEEFKMKCNPFADPGYKPWKSDVLGEVVTALQKYRNAWSIYDELPPERNPDTVYGYMKQLITEDLMNKIHLDCRAYVDEMMRLDLKLLIKMHQKMYKRVGWKYPKLVPRKKPKELPLSKTLDVDCKVLKNLEELFDLGIITKPTSKMKDIVGDYSYGAYDYNIEDPDAKFPLPSYGDVKRRLLLSCVFGSGLVPGATRRKAVMLLGPERQGKSFLVDCVAGEMNAIKIDISPEKFSAMVDRPGKLLGHVFTAARVFQPAVIYMRNVERVFAKKVQPQDKYLNAKSMKTALIRLLKALPGEAKVIFIATCSDPWSAKAKAMVSMFSEVIMVPRTDYNTLQLFFYHSLQRIQSMPRDYCVHALAQILQGYGMGVVLELYHQVMSSERIVRLNVTPLSPSEFLEPLIEKELEPLSVEDYEEYAAFFIQTSALKNPRAEYETINVHRKAIYKKFGNSNEAQNY